MPENPTCRKRHVQVAVALSRGARNGKKSGRKSNIVPTNAGD
jgi:hypothetical protein